MSRRKEERELQFQWLFVVLGAFLAVFVGLATNALYSIIKNIYPDWAIAIFFGGLGLLLADAFMYLFENLREVRNSPDESFRYFLKQYFKARLNSLRFKKRG